MLGMRLDYSYVLLRIMALIGLVCLVTPASFACFLKPKSNSFLHVSIPVDLNEVEYVGQVEPEFVGKVETISVRRDFIRAKYTAKYRVIDSITHSHHIGRIVFVRYGESSCGPRAGAGQTGFLIGEIDKPNWRGRLKVTPLSPPPLPNWNVPEEYRR